MQPFSMSNALVRNVMVAALLMVPLALTVFSLAATLIGTNDGTSLLDMSVLWPWLAFLSALGAMLFTVATWVRVRYAGTLGRSARVVYGLLVFLPLLAVPARVLLFHPPAALGLAVGFALFLALARVPNAGST